MKQAIAVAAFLGILRIVHDYVTYPRLIGQGIHLHPLVVISYPERNWGAWLATAARVPAGFRRT